MSNGLENETLLELYIFETAEQLAKLENIALQNEQDNSLQWQINEVFRLIHTMKGSSAVMNYMNIVELTHSLEDIFYYIREFNPAEADYSLLTDIVLKSIDFIKNEINIIQSSRRADSDVTELVVEVKDYLDRMSGKGNVFTAKAKEADAVRKDSATAEGETQYKAVIFFEEGCEMENVRAFNIIYKIEKVMNVIGYHPPDIMDQESTEFIRKNGFTLFVSTKLEENEVKKILENTIFISALELEVCKPVSGERKTAEEQGKVKSDSQTAETKQNMVSVNLTKMDWLMDLVGELVISQAMVIQNPELQGIKLNSFHKASRQLQLVTKDIQNAVMSLRMISLSMTFHKMNRIVRDMSKRLKKEIHLQLIGEDTEVDKNIIEHLSDPLLHLVRNAADHGIEDADIRVKEGKPAAGTVILEAKNDGGDVKIIVRDDGRGLDKDRILCKAREQGLLKKPDVEYTDKEIYSMILMPGFSTNENVTEYSGRGVGMDVVNKHIEELGGSIQIDSCKGKYTSFLLKIPLTLAIIEGMKIRNGRSIYTIPITAIRESFRISDHNIIYDETAHREMLMIRGECVPVLRLSEYFKAASDVTRLENGIIVVVENEMKTICLFADELMGIEQVVIKALPEYINKRKGISSCTVMGDGNVSLIINVPDLFNNI